LRASDSCVGFGAGRFPAITPGIVPSHAGFAAGGGLGAGWGAAAWTAVGPDSATGGGGWFDHGIFGAGSVSGSDPAPVPPKLATCAEEIWEYR